jgi:hypothetical protein
MHVTKRRRRGGGDLAAAQRLREQRGDRRVAARRAAPLAHRAHHGEVVDILRPKGKGEGRERSLGGGGGAWACCAWREPRPLSIVAVAPPMTTTALSAILAFWTCSHAAPRRLRAPRRFEWSPGGGRPR